jgi:hypothetical protein
MTSCCNLSPPKTQFGGDLASSVTNKAIRQANECNVRAAIARARTNPACAGCLPPTPGFQGGVAEGMFLAKKMMSCTPLSSTQARQLADSQLKGVPSSVRTQQIQAKTIQDYAAPDDPLRRFVIYQGPVITPPCPPTPAEQLNSTRPKVSNANCLAQVPFYQRTPQ